MPRTNNPGRYLPPQPPIPTMLQVSRDFTFRLSVSGPNQVYKLARVILSKHYLKGWEPSKEEEVALFEITQYLENRRTTREQHQSTRWLSLVRLIRLTLDFQGKEIPKWAKAQIGLLKPQVLLTPRALRGIDPGFVRKFIKRTNRLLRRNPPPVPYIGVGYGDKGTAKRLAWDGTPHWKEHSILWRTEPSLEEKARRIQEQTFKRMLVTVDNSQ